MLPWIAIAAFAADPGFYPNSGPERIALDADGTVRGLPRTGDVLVRSDDLAALAALPEVAAVIPLRGRPTGPRVARVVPRPGIDDLALSVALRERDDVAWAHPDLVVSIRPASLPDDPYVLEQWHLENTGQQGFTPGVDIGASDAWEITRGAGQVVAILDSGVDIDHPDLRVIDGTDYVDGDDSSDAVGDDAHGTACAGLAVGIGDNSVGTSGVAYEASAYGIRMIGSNTLGDLYDAFAEAVDAGATVLSNSWGFEDDCNGVSDYGIIADAFEYAETEGRAGLGAAVVFAVGNGNCDISGNAMLANPTVIGVAAVSGFDVREGYSAFGPWVDVAAPSGGMYTADIVGPAGYNGYPGDDSYTTWFNGTSASTPVVAGVLALMFAANDRLTAAGARDALCDTAVRIDLDAGDYDEAGWSPYYGCGRVNASAAVRAVLNLGPPVLPVLDAVGTIPPDAAIIGWSAPSDPDGDYVLHTVRWRIGTGAWTLVDTDRAWLDLTGEV
nr:S8 family serine peptidase [Deltaproteobacteria bacterium]